MIEIHCEDRWLAYRRLIELEIDCSCRGYCPLTVRVDNPNQAIQVWSTTQWISQKRVMLSQRLERCWQLPVPPVCKKRSSSHRPSQTNSRDS